MSFSIDRNNRRKDILWKRDKTKAEIMKINLRTAWRRFDTQTKGMGLIFVLFFSAMILINVVPFVYQSIHNSIIDEKYNKQLSNACTDKFFYALNFEKCEGIGARP